MAQGHACEGETIVDVSGDEVDDCAAACKANARCNCISLHATGWGGSSDRCRLETGDGHTDRGNWGRGDFSAITMPEYDACQAGAIAAHLMLTCCSLFPHICSLAPRICSLSLIFLLRVRRRRRRGRGNRWLSFFLSHFLTFHNFPLAFSHLFFLAFVTLFFSPVPHFSHFFAHQRPYCPSSSVCARRPASAPALPAGAARTRR